MDAFDHQAHATNQDPREHLNNIRNGHDMHGHEGMTIEPTEPLQPAPNSWPNQAPPTGPRTDPVDERI